MPGQFYQDTSIPFSLYEGFCDPQGIHAPVDDLPRSVHLIGRDILFRWDIRLQKNL